VKSKLIELMELEEMR